MTFIIVSYLNKSRLHFRRVYKSGVSKVLAMRIIGESGEVYYPRLTIPPVANQSLICSVMRSNESLQTSV